MVEVLLVVRLVSVVNDQQPATVPSAFREKVRGDGNLPVKRTRVRASAAELDLPGPVRVCFLSGEDCERLDMINSVGCWFPSHRKRPENYAR